jgi:chitinase
MVEASTAALDAAYRQLRGAYDRSGSRLAPESLWGRLGVTPMIGQNDYTTDRLTTGDARALLDAARERGVTRISMWSLNRDARCGANVDPAVANNYCSGVDQDPLDFSQIFDSVDGRPTSVSVPEVAYDPQDIPIDDPATSPYPIWRERTEYEEGERVVWRGDVYEAKWWNVTEPPDAPVVNEWESPWRLLGPVLPEERAHPTTTTTIPDGTYPEWVRTEVYEEGDRVQHDGVGYEAKWWTSGDVPGADVDNDWETPWEVVGLPDED